MSKLTNLIRKLCPSGVEHYTLGDVLISTPKGTLKQSELIADGQYPVINSGREYYGYYDKYNNEPDVITIASRGEYAGFIRYSNQKFWAGGLCYPYRSKNNNLYNTKYIFYCLKNRESYIRNTLVAEGGIPALNKSDIEKMVLPIPPLPIQEEIVRILDNFTDLTKELTKELNDRKKQYEYYRDSLLTLDGDTKEYKIGDLAKIVTKQTGFDYSSSIKPNLKLENNGDCIPYLQTKNFSDTTFDYNTDYFVPIMIVNKFPKITLDEKCILFSIVGASIGNVGLFPATTKCFLGGAICVVKLKSDVNIDYVYHYMKSYAGQRQIICKTKGAGQATVTVDDIRNMTIKMPSTEVQEKIVNVLNSFEKICNDLDIGLPAEIELRQKQYEYYRDKLLSFN